MIDIDGCFVALSEIEIKMSDAEYCRCRFKVIKSPADLHHPASVESGMNYDACKWWFGLLQKTRSLSVNADDYLISLSCNVVENTNSSSTLCVLRLAAT